VEDFTPSVQLALREKVAAEVNVAVSAVALNVTAASALLTFELMLPAHVDASDASAALSAQLAGPATTSVFLNITVESIKVMPTVVFAPPPPFPPCPPGSRGMIGLGYEVEISVLAGAPLVLICIVMCHKLWKLRAARRADAAKRVAEKAAAEKAAAERTRKVEAEKAAAEKAAAERTRKAEAEKAAAEKAAAERTRKAEAEKAAAEKAAAERTRKAEAEKAAAEKVAVEKAAAEEKVVEQKASKHKSAAEKAASTPTFNSRVLRNNQADKAEEEAIRARAAAPAPTGLIEQMSTRLSRLSTFV
jgi:uncharacterized membrane protein